MFEHFSDPLPSQFRFAIRFARNFLVALGIIVGSLLLGMLGYRYFDTQNWTDAYLNATMILSGMGPVDTPRTAAGKVFAGTYALYSGFIVILASGVALAPIIHRMLHRFHLSGEHRRRPAHPSAPPPETIP